MLVSNSIYECSPLSFIIFKIIVLLFLVNLYVFLGVADQLQTNYASELRHILRAVFDCYAIDRNIEVAEDALNLQLTNTNQPGRCEIVSSVDHRDSAAQLRSAGIVIE